MARYGLISEIRSQKASGLPDFRTFHARLSFVTFVPSLRDPLCHWIWHKFNSGSNKTCFMKKIMIFLVASLVMSAANAQTPESDTLRDPVKQGDPEVRTAPVQAAYRKDMVVIKAAQLPAPLKKL